MRILIIGAGMYVTGRNNTGYGTILSSIAEYSRNINLDLIVVASKSQKSKVDLAESTFRINDKLSTKINVDFQIIDENFQEFINQNNFDLCIISVPDHLHFHYCKIALESNLHCLVVKPLTPTIAEALELIKIQERNGLHAVVEFHKRYDESNLIIKDLFKGGKIGKPLYFDVNYSQRLEIPTVTFKDWVEKTNIFQYLGVHYVDLIYFITNFQPIRLTAVGTYGKLKDQNINTYDSIHSIIEWKHKEIEHSFFSVFNISWIDTNNSSAMSDQKYSFVGTEGRLECNQKNRGLELVNNQNGHVSFNPYFSEYLLNEDSGYEYTGYGFKSIKQFLDDVADLKNNKFEIEYLSNKRPSFRDSLISVRVTDAVNKSLSINSEWVEIK